MAAYQGLEFKVGLFTLIALLSALIAAKYMGYAPQRGEYYHLKVVFSNAGGISEGSPVYMSGVKIGEVEAVGIDPKTYKAMVTLKISRKIKVPVGSTFIVGGSLMGERYVYIDPKPSDKYFSDGDVIRRNVVGAVEWSELMIAGKNAFQSLDRAARKLETVISDLKVGDEVRRVLGEAESALREAKLAAATLRERIDTLGDSLERLSETTRAEIMRTSDNANALLVDARKQVNQVGESVRATSDELRAVLRENREDLRRLISNLNDASEDLKGILSENRRDIRESVQNIRDITRTLKEDVNAVSPLLKDRKLHQDIRTAVAKGREVVETAEFLLSPVKQLREKTLKEKGFRFSMPQVEILYVQNYQHNPVTTLNVDIFPYSKQFFRLGIFDLGHENLLNLQVGYWNDEMTKRLRMGMIESQLGVGMESRLSDKLWLSLDLYNPSRITLNSFLIYGEPSRYSLKVGYRDVLRRSRAFTLGLFKTF